MGEGWKLVPVTPTEQMIEALDNWWEGDMRKCMFAYRQMLAVAPSAAAPASPSPDLQEALTALKGLADLVIGSWGPPPAPEGAFEIVSRAGAILKKHGFKVAE